MMFSSAPGMDFTMSLRSSRLNVTMMFRSDSGRYHWPLIGITVAGGTVLYRRGNALSQQLL